MYHHSLTEAVSGHMFCFHCKPFINFSWSTRGSNMWRQMSSKPYKSGGHALLSDDLFGLKGPGLRGNGITHESGLHRHHTSVSVAATPSSYKVCLLSHSLFIILSSDILLPLALVFLSFIPNSSLRPTNYFGLVLFLSPISNHLFPQSLGSSNLKLALGYFCLPNQT